MKSFAILIVLVDALFGSCGEGCLKCSSEDKCLICDFQNFYLLKENACEKTVIDFC